MQVLVLGFFYFFSKKIFYFPLDMRRLICYNFGPLAVTNW